MRNSIRLRRVSRNPNVSECWHSVRLPACLNWIRATLNDAPLECIRLPCPCRNACTPQRGINKVSRMGQFRGRAIESNAVRTPSSHGGTVGALLSGEPSVVKIQNIFRRLDTLFGCYFSDYAERYASKIREPRIVHFDQVKPWFVGVLGVGDTVEHL